MNTRHGSNSWIGLGALAGLLAFSVACGSGSQMNVLEGAGGGAGGLGAVGRGYAGPTYMRDLRPIIVAKCKACHPGMGPGDWLVYSEAKAKAGRIKQKVFIDKTMPMGGTLTDAERKMFADWADNGAVEDAPAGDDAPSAGLPAQPSQPSGPEPTQPAQPPQSGGADPVYNRDLRPIIEARCKACHPGVGPGDWLNYGQIREKAKRIKEKVFIDKTMPMGGTLTDAERKMFADWADGVESGAIQPSEPGGPASPRPEFPPLPPVPEPAVPVVEVPVYDGPFEPTSPYTYERDIRPIFEARCSSCHSASSPRPNWMDYDTAIEKADRIYIKVVNEKSMPMPPVVMEDSEREMIAQWFLGGTPR